MRLVNRRRLAVAFAAVIAIGGALLVPTSDRTAQASSAGNGTDPGPDEVVFVFVGAKFCGAHRRDGFAEVIDEARLRLGQFADARGWRFVATGVALDWSVEDGLEFLKHFGAWDDVIAGRNWFGFGAITFVWRDLSGEAAVPQVVVLHRRVERLPEAVIVSQDRILARLAGANAIEEWVESGVPLQEIQSVGSH